MAARNNRRQHPKQAKRPVKYLAPPAGAAYPSKPIKRSDRDGQRWLLHVLEEGIPDRAPLERESNHAAIDSFTDKQLTTLLHANGFSFVTAKELQVVRAQTTIHTSTWVRPGQTNDQGGAGRTVNFTQLARQRR